MRSPVLHDVYVHALRRLKYGDPSFTANPKYANVSDGRIRNISQSSIGRKKTIIIRRRRPNVNHRFYSLTYFPDITYTLHRTNLNTVSLAPTTAYVSPLFSFGSRVYTAQRFKLLRILKNDMSKVQSMFNFLSHKRL